jgi:hypothetical protein
MELTVWCSGSLAYRRNFVMSGDISAIKSGKALNPVPDISWVETRDTAEHSTTHRTAPTKEKSGVTPVILATWEAEVGRI